MIALAAKCAEGVTVGEGIAYAGISFAAAVAYIGYRATGGWRQ